ncbi:MAG: DUF4234 domain-containing protein [Cytophagales bacterium]|nr:DUF4234 domain-containing protein [Cytophaga sp.]
MENEETPLDQEVSEHESLIEPQEIIRLPVFILLCILTCGLYQIWWSYKAWKFFKEKDQLDIIPALRAIFALFFLYALLERIKEYGFQKKASLYSSALLFIGFVTTSLLGNLPPPYLLISVLNVLFLVPAFEVLNYSKQVSSDLIVKEIPFLNDRHLFLVVTGIVFWILIITGIMHPQVKPV